MKRKIDEFTQILTSETFPNIGLMSGLGGQILVCSELFLQKQIPQEWLDTLHQVLEERLTNEEFMTTHCNGLSGIGWLYEHLSQRKVITYDTNILLEEFDSYLEKSLQKFMIENNYDFLHGGVGVALYFAKRVHKKRELVLVLNQFIEDLEKISAKQEEGTLKWLSHLGNTDSQGYNISLSHGMSSIVVILSKLYKIEGINKQKTETLLRGAIQYILAQEIDKDRYGSYFTNFALESMPEIVKSRLAWCYGDLGIAAALYQAGKALNENRWIDKALDIFLFSASQKDDTIGDAILCHGTAGIGHIFYRMWLNTQMPEFKKATDYWFEIALKMAIFPDGLAGYKTKRTNEWVNKYELLEGIAGTCLAMATYYYEIEPEWDECLLLS